MNHDAIDWAIQEVKKEFPFPEVIDETIDAIRPIAVVIQELAPNGARVLDLGCGALDKAMVLQKMGYQCCGADDFQDAWHRNQENLNPVLSYVQSMGI